MNKKLLVLLACVAVMVLLPACGGSKKIKTDAVTGTVTLDGAPLAGATVYFNPTDTTGSQAVGTTDENGVYKLQTLLGAVDAGTTPGEYGVAITCVKVVKEATETTDEVTENAIPAKYNSDKTSGFTATVVHGENKFDFDLQSK